MILSEALQDLTDSDAEKMAQAFGLLRKEDVNYEEQREGFERWLKEQDKE